MSQGFFRFSWLLRFSIFSFHNSRISAFRNKKLKRFFFSVLVIRFGFRFDAVFGCVYMFSRISHFSFLIPKERIPNVKVGKNGKDVQKPQWIPNHKSQNMTKSEKKTRGPKCRKEQSTLSARRSTCTQIFLGRNFTYHLRTSGRSGHITAHLFQLFLSELLKRVSVRHNQESPCDHLFITPPAVFRSIKFKKLS